MSWEDPLEPGLWWRALCCWCLWCAALALPLALALVLVTPLVFLAPALVSAPDLRLVPPARPLPFALAAAFVAEAFAAGTAAADPPACTPEVPLLPATIIALLLLLLTLNCPDPLALQVGDKMAEVSAFRYPKSLRGNRDEEE